jgi:hypothetical protein
MRLNIRKIVFLLALGHMLLFKGPIRAQGGLPTGWSDGDIGTVGVSGGAAYSNDVFTVTGAGTSLSVGKTSDSFHFLYQSLSGDGAIVARITSVQGSTIATAGVMIRESLNANSTYEFMYFQKLGSFEADYRPSTGGSASGQNQASMSTLPYWLKAVRSGTSFSAYISADGLNFVQMGPTVTISMAQNIYIGLGFATSIHPVSPPWRLTTYQ